MWSGNIPRDRRHGEFCPGARRAPGRGRAPRQGSDAQPHLRRPAHYPAPGRFARRRRNPARRFCRWHSLSGRPGHPSPARPARHGPCPWHRIRRRLSGLDAVAAPIADGRFDAWRVLSHAVRAHDQASLVQHPHALHAAPLCRDPGIERAGCRNLPSDRTRPRPRRRERGRYRALHRTRQSHRKDHDLFWPAGAQQGTRAAAPLVRRACRSRSRMAVDRRRQSDGRFAGVAAVAVRRPGDRPDGGIPPIAERRGTVRADRAVARLCLRVDL